jgi:hypothetical protein
MRGRIKVRLRPKQRALAFVALADKGAVSNLGRMLGGVNVLGYWGNP